MAVSIHVYGAEWTGNIACGGVYSVNVGENEHQDTAKHTDMSHRLMAHDMDGHYEPPFANGGAILGHNGRFAPVVWNCARAELRLYLTDYRVV